MSITPTQLRKNLYNILDQVLETNRPVEIIRDGQLLEISAKQTKKKMFKLANLEPHPGTIQGAPEDLVNIDWSNSWNKDVEL